MIHPPVIFAGLDNYGNDSAAVAPITLRNLPSLYRFLVYCGGSTIIHKFSGETLTISRLPPRRTSRDDMHVEDKSFNHALCSILVFMRNLLTHHIVH
jgi:hypothetical protein